MGLRYRRSAGVGASTRRGGILSSVNGTFGSIDMMDLVRKSSGVIIGVVRLENDFAADLKARSDAVKFDLNADLRRGGSTPVVSCWSLGKSDGLWKTLKSSSSTSTSDKGWSCRVSSPANVGWYLLVGKDLLPLELGVIIELGGVDASLREASSKDGTDSLDVVLLDMTDPGPFSEL